MQRTHSSRRAAAFLPSELSCAASHSQCHTACWTVHGRGALLSAYSVPISHTRTELELSPHPPMQGVGVHGRCIARWPEGGSARHATLACWPAAAGLRGRWGTHQDLRKRGCSGSWVTLGRVSIELRRHTHSSLHARARAVSAWEEARVRLSEASEVGHGPGTYNQVRAVILARQPLLHA